MNLDLNALRDFIVQLAEQHWLDLLPILIGTLAGLLLTAGLEYFIPVNWNQRYQKGIIWLSTIGISWLLSTLLWGTLDPADSRLTRSIWSLSCSVIAVRVYPLFARWATKKWPEIGSVYTTP